ncbi:DUF2637 domain-containing protein [Streptomyces sp. CME 23]|nr:DUF2637 domain-containing protein [Streptomyces sp. CME 23]MCH5677314.1 DUF2637 domain-containing protein [Streptomyces sp. CME 23]
MITAGTAIVAGIGFTGSYTALRQLATRKGFGSFAYLFPVGIDAGICVLLALDLYLTHHRIPFPLLRQTAWLLTAATIAFNGAAAWPDPLGVGMHGVIPLLFIVAVEAARHAIAITDITADTHMEGVRPARWLLSPIRTFLLWRRMKLWELRSYQQAITLEQERLVYQARLHSRFGRAWRRKAPVESLIPLRLARYGIPLADTAPAGLAAADIKPTPITPAIQREAAHAAPATDTEPAAHDTAATPAPATTSTTHPGKQHSPPDSHTQTPPQLQAPRPALTTEPELHTHPRTYTRPGQQTPHSPGRPAHSPSGHTSPHTTSGKPPGAPTLKDQHDQNRAALTEAGTTPRSTNKPNPVHPTHAHAQDPDATTGTHQDTASAPGSDPFGPEPRTGQPNQPQRLPPRQAASAPRHQPGHVTPPPAVAPRTTETTRPSRTRQTPRQTTSPDHQTPHRSTSHNLTLPDRYYLAWQDYQTRHGTQPTGQQLSAHLATQGLLGRGQQPISPANLRRHFLRWRTYNIWATHRAHDPTPSPTDIAHECARLGITAQYNKPLTPPTTSRH